MDLIGQLGKEFMEQKAEIKRLNEIITRALGQLIPEANQDQELLDVIDILLEYAPTGGTQEVKIANAKTDEGITDKIISGRYDCIKCKDTGSISPYRKPECYCTCGVGQARSM